MSLHCTYQYAAERDTLESLYTFAWQLVSEAAVFAEEIGEKMYENDETRVYGRMCRIRGKSVSPVQFMLTDSLHRFFRGALYFDSETDADSVMPVVDYVAEDVKELVESFEWK